MEQLQIVLEGMWGTLLAMSPYLLFGFLVAGVLSVFVSPSLVERHLGGHGLWPITKASAFGVPLPLCSCGVIPVAASLRRHGASRGATTSFLLSTPQTGADSILVTLSLLGPIYAIFRPLAALVTGIVGGLAVSVLTRNGEEQGAPPEACTDDCCSGDAPANPLLRALNYGFVTLPRDIGKSLLVGLAVAGVIAAAVPSDFASTYGTGLTGMLAMMVIGIPLYVCATASVPIAAALMLKGVSPGAALVFLMTGPATNAASIATVWHVMGRRTAIIYLATVVGAAFGFGLLLDLVGTVVTVAAVPHVHEAGASVVQIAFAVVLVGVLANAFRYKPHGHAGEAHPGDDDMITLSVQGMSCSHCVANVTRALQEAPGVTSVDVDLDSAMATIGGDVDAETLRVAVDALGFHASVKEEGACGCGCGDGGCT
ncbi:SO_0444 family Cu/Zn efflux transporter [bacterium]|nr:SO_0444 family Cu/Zn efflux transporter [bacterium]